MAHVPENGRATVADAHLINAGVTDAAGHRATIVSTEETAGQIQAWIELDGGARVLVPVSLLAHQTDGNYRLPFTFTISSEGPGAQTADRLQLAFPVIQEEAHVGKRVVDTGRGVRIHKTVSEREHAWDEALSRDELVIEHVPVGRMVAESETPQMRYEGDTLVLPVLEEVLVVQKQLRLKEEVRVTRRRHQVRQPQSVLLRSEQVTVERFDEGRK